LTPRDAITLGEARGLYRSLAGRGIGERFLAEALNLFPHLKAWSVVDVYDRRPGANWSNEGWEAVVVEAGVDRKRFEYFVKTRKALYSTGNPVIIFSPNAAAPPGPDGKGLKYEEVY
jgi:hypothetical protein